MNLVGGSGSQSGSQSRPGWLMSGPLRPAPAGRPTSPGRDGDRGAAAMSSLVAGSTVARVSRAPRRGSGAVGGGRQLAAVSGLDRPASATIMAMQPGRAALVDRLPLPADQGSPSAVRGRRRKEDCRDGLGGRSLLALDEVAVHILRPTGIRQQSPADDPQTPEPPYSRIWV